VAKRSFYHSVSVDVDIDSSVLEENGYHHEEDCEKLDIEDELIMKFILESRQSLEDWHDKKHGLGHWTSCSFEPCSLLKDEFKTLHEKA
jgi:hypothetical protein